MKKICSPHVTFHAISQEGTVLVLRTVDLSGRGNAPQCICLMSGQPIAYCAPVNLGDSDSANILCGTAGYAVPCVFIRSLGTYHLQLAHCWSSSLWCRKSVCGWLRRVNQFRPWALACTTWATHHLELNLACTNPMVEWVLQHALDARNIDKVST